MKGFVVFALMLVLTVFAVTVLTEEASACPAVAVASCNQAVAVQSFVPAPVAVSTFAPTFAVQAVAVQPVFVQQHAVAVQAVAVNNHCNAVAVRQANVRSRSVVRVRSR